MNNPTISSTVAAIALCVGAASAGAQSDQRLVVPLSDPSRPAILEIHLFMGDIRIQAYEGNEVLIVTDTPVRNADDDEEDEPRADGLRKIQRSAVGITVEEGDNTVSLRTDFSNRNVDIDVSVPRRTSVRANLITGDIAMTGVTGEHELASVNGDVLATDITGSAVINSTNGDVRVILNEIDADRPMSFTSFNGDVDVSLPANLAADLIVASQQGDVFTDFDVEVQQDPAVVERNRGAGGRYRVRMQRETRYSIGGGGPDIQLRTFNGDVMIRKR
jgi:DUF4097 and DUF4098 domain-containing protein YvlB